MKHIITIIFACSLLTLGYSPAIAGQFVVELDAPLGSISPDQLAEESIEVNHTFSAGAESYAVFTAPDKQTLISLSESIDARFEKISEVLFINSPTLGGGEKAGETPRDGHQVFIIERPIPGVGFFGLDKKKKISKGSNNAIDKLGEIIEWDHSYLTSKGTYCVYRADSSETLREHGALAGAPIGKITPVQHSAYIKSQERNQ